MSEFKGEPLQTVKVYDEDEEVEVKYEPFDSELIRESEILGYDSGCLTCQKVIKKITTHLTDHIGSSSNDVDGRTESPEYIVDPNYIIKIDPEDDFVNSEPRDVGIMNDTQRPGSHDSRNSGQRQWKVLDFDTGQCSPDCEICKKYLRELKEHLGINHPQLQFQPSCAPAPLPQRSAVYGPLKTLENKNTRPHLRQIAKTVDGTYILKVVLTPDMEKQNRLEDMRRKTRTSMRAGYAEESIHSHPGSSKPVKKKSRPDSDRNDQNKNEESKPTNRVSHGENSHSENKSKESESDGRSSNEIGTEVDFSELNPTSAVTLGENAESSDSHEINLTDHVSHTGGNQDITHTGDVFTEMSKTTVEEESVMTIHGGRQPEMDRSGQGIYQQTDTGEKQAVIVPVGGRYGEMSRIPEKVSHNKEEPTNLGQIMSEPAKSVDTAGEFPNLTHTVDKPSMTTRGVEIPARLTHSGGNWNPRRMLKHQIRKRLKPSESESTSTTPLDNFYNCKKCRKVFSTRSNLLYHHNVVHSVERFECAECGKSFISRSTLTLHKKIHKVRNNLLVENGGKELTEHVVTHTVGNSATPPYTTEEPVTTTLIIGNPTRSSSADADTKHKKGRETENVGVSLWEKTCSDGNESMTIYSGGESHETAHNRDNPGPVTRIEGKPENVDRTAVTLGKSANMTPGEAKLIPVGGMSGNLSRTGGKLDEMNRTEEIPKKLSCITGESGKTDQNVGSADLNNSHMEMDSEEGAFKCDICDRSAMLTLHKLDHIVFRCDECDRTFSSSDRFREHKIHHVFRALYMCDECGQGFESLDSLEMHHIIHIISFLI